MKKRKSYVVLIFMLAGLIATAYIMNFSPIGQPLLMQYGDGTGMIDFRFFYTQNELLDFTVSLGATGGSVYKSLLIIDFFFIICLAYIMAFLLRLFITRLKLPAKYSRLSWLSYLRGIFDCLENIMLLLCLSGYYTSFPFPGFFTALKWVTMVAYFVVLTVLLFWALLQSSKAR